jgi:hypothetical protein
LKVALGGGKVVKSRFAADESQFHERARGVVDVDQQRAARSTIFEPVVVAAVDLNELTEAFSARTRWLRTLAALGPRLPDAGVDEPFAQCLEPDRNSVELASFSRARVGPKSR